jgi:hypothetical protein
MERWEQTQHRVASPQWEDIFPIQLAANSTEGTRPKLPPSSSHTVSHQVPFVEGSCAKYLVVLTRATADPVRGKDHGGALYAHT